MRGLLLIALSALAGTVVGQGACFVPNGTNRHDLTNANIQKYVACDSGGHSMCCNRAGDKCQPDGLCWSEEHRQLWRESCTDPTWQSPKCLKLCISDEYTSDDGTPASGMDMMVTQCTDGSYCCGNGQNATECCNSGRGVRIVNGQVVASTALESSSTTFTSLLSATSAPSTLGFSTATISSLTSHTSLSSTASPTATPNSTSDDTESSGSKGGVIGGAVGGGVCAAAVGLAAWFFWLKRRKRSNDSAGAEAELAGEKPFTVEEAMAMPLSPAPRYTPREFPREPPRETPGEVSELPGHPHPVELESGPPPKGW
ncbi:hypothetical protein CPLU01_00573 [Colletotrichum plurivorum]|uniref:Uncharacterized protein n=1 Tax=Colletotrichum plurivorum TaxID=2175906 RepID=A0A8H6NRU2_9PEZI|nr:hypothetical protein CPLU01_00573 [Colletotrichum plurivorum]